MTGHRFMWILAFLLAASVAADFLVSPYSHFGLDGSFAFNAWYGFAACLGFAVLARLVAAILQRPDEAKDE